MCPGSETQEHGGEKEKDFFHDKQFCTAKLLLFSQKAFSNRTNLFSNRTKVLFWPILLAVLEGSEAGEVFEDTIEGLVGGKAAECHGVGNGIVVRGEVG